MAAAFVGLWAQMNYEQLTSLFRVEERSVAYVTASLVNIGITIGATLLLVVALDAGPLGVIVGNFTGTLLVYAALIGYRREQFGLQFDRGLLREMNRFGLPLVPSALFLWMTNFSDRFFIVKLADTEEVGLYSIGVRIASVMAMLVTAFRTGVAGVRLLDRGRGRGAQDVRLRADLRRRSSRPGSQPASACSRPGSSTRSRRPTSPSPLASSRRSRSRSCSSPAMSSS